MIAKFHHEFYFAVSLGLSINNYSFLKQNYSQMVRTILHDHPSVCVFYTISAAIHLFKFQQEEITGVRVVNALPFISNFSVNDYQFTVNMLFIHCICSTLYILINFLILYHNLFTQAVVDETFIWNSTKICKSIVGFNASQLYPYSMCQPMPTGLYTRWKYDTDSNRFKPQQNKSRSFENMVMSYFQRQRPDCKIDSFYTTGTQRKIDCFKAHGFCAHCNTVFEALRCFYHYCQ